MRHKLKVVTHLDVHCELFRKLTLLENEIYGDKGIDADYFRSLHSKYNDDLFVLIDTETNSPVGFMEAIFLAESTKNKYLEDHNYNTLENIGAQIGENILYIFSLALKEEYRGTGVFKLLAKEFARWLDKIQKHGKKLTYVFGEAISTYGVKSLVQSMGMVPINRTDLDADGLGFYYSPDCLKSYISHQLKRK